MTLVCAHRGASGTRPENTMAAFTAAVAMGADMIETDVRRAADGRLVLAHDPIPEGVAGHVALADLVAYARGVVALDVELKEPGCEAEALDLLAPRPDGLLVSSFHPQVVEELGRLDPGISRGLVLGASHEGDPVRAARECAATSLVLHRTLLDDTLLRRTRRAGLPVLIWTVNDQTHLRALLREPGIAAVITDHPDRAVRARAA
jgi:glycerophosphoryl diester phosphodiesterase